MSLLLRIASALFMEMFEAVEDEVETEFEFVVDAVCGSERAFSYLEEMRILLRGYLLAAGSRWLGHLVSGGDLAWYGLANGLRARMALGLLFGERWRLGRPRAITTGASVDWWVIARRRAGELVLRSVVWFPGEGWLGWRVDADELVQVGALRTKGVPGFLYWKLLQPIHRRVFALQARHRVTAVRGEG